MKTYKYKINGATYEVTIKGVAEPQGHMLVEVNGKQFTVENLEAPKPAKKVVPPRPVASAPAPSPSSSAPRATASAGGGHAVKSPLPGVILDVKVREGDTVKIGQPLLILEAMKMENNIEADRDGVVSKVMVKQGDSVMEGDTLVTIGG